MTRQQSRDGLQARHSNHFRFGVRLLLALFVLLPTQVMAKSMSGNLFDIVQSAVAAASDEQTQAPNAVEADLAVTITPRWNYAQSGNCQNIAGTYTPGCHSAYEVAVVNHGPDDADGAIIQITRQDGSVSPLQVSCSASGSAKCPTSYAGISSGVAAGDFPSGTSLTFTVIMLHDVDAAYAYSSIQASATTPAGVSDPVLSNNTRTSAQMSRNNAANVGVSVTAVADSNPQGLCVSQLDKYTPGCPAHYVVTLANAGPDTAKNIHFTMRRGEEHAAGFEWTCSASPGASCPSTEGEDPFDGFPFPDLPSGATLTYAITVAHTSGDLYTEAGIEAEASVTESAVNGYDIDLSDNTASATREIHRRVFLRTEKRALQNGSDITQVSANESFDYEITVYNDGPSDIGNSIDDELEDLPPGHGLPALQLEDVFDTRLQGISGDCTSIGNLPCWRACPTTLGDWGNDDDDAPVTVADADDCAVEPVAASGTVLSQNFHLRAGTGSRIVSRVLVPHVSEPTTVSNAATLSITPCDQDPGCSPINLVDDTLSLSDSVDVLVLPSASAAISIDAPAGQDATPGLPYSYTITVTNTGNAHLPNAAIHSNLLPPPASPYSGFVPGSISYRCESLGGGICFVGGATGQTEPTPPVQDDTLSVNSNIPQGGSVTFTVSGLLDPRGTGDMLTKASVDPGSGAEPAEDELDIELKPEYGVKISKRFLGRDSQTPPGLDFEIVVRNTGPSFIAGAALADGASTVVASDFNLSEASWQCEIQSDTVPATPLGGSQCSQTSGTGGIGDAGNSLLLDLMPGTRAVVPFSVPASHSAGNQVENKAALTLASGGSFEASAHASLYANYTLDVEKSDGLTVAHPGAKGHEYAITIRNEGPDDAYDVRVLDAMPSELQNIQWSCAAVSPVPGDLADLQAGINPASKSGIALEVSSDGRQVYVLTPADANGEARLLAYRRNATPGRDYGRIEHEPFDEEINGVDDPSDSGSAVEGMDNPVDMALTPDGSMLYVLATTDGGTGSAASHIVAFNRSRIFQDPEYGKLSYAGTVQTTIGTARQIVATNTHVYVSGVESGTAQGKVEVFRLNSSTQLPMAVDVGPLTAPLDAGPMVIDAAHAFVYVASGSTTEVTRYEILSGEQNAGLLRMDGSTASAQPGFTRISSMAIAPNGRDLYVYSDGQQSGSGNPTTEPRIGHLKSEAGLAYNSDYAGSPGSPLQGLVRLAMSPDGEHLLGVNTDLAAAFSMRRNTTTGGLGGGHAVYQEVEQWLTFDGASGSDQAQALASPIDLLVTPDNRHVLIASGSGGPVSVLSRRAPPPQLGFIEYDQSGDEGNEPPFYNLTGAADVVTRGEFVYALSKEDAAINLFQRHLDSGSGEDGDGGHLTHVAVWLNGDGGITGMSRPDRMLISPDGNSLFVSSVDGDSIAVFRRDNGNGELTFAGSFNGATHTALRGANGMAMNRSGKHLYVAGSYASSIAIFAHDANSPTRLTYQGSVVGGQNGVTGMNGIRDLVLAGDDNRAQLIGVSDVANSVVVFDRRTDGSLGFVQSLNLGPDQRPMALAISPDVNNSDNAHVYVAAQNANAIHILQRVLDSTSPQAGRVRVVGSMVAGGDAPDKMIGPRAIAVSGNGKRVYVAAQFGSSLVAFDRYDSPSSDYYGELTPAETRTQNVDAVDGIANPYAVAVSEDSRNVYVAGFDSDAVASFSVGTGSSCSASGSGDIDDVVTIRAGGAVMYTVTSDIRVDASGTLENTVQVETEKGDYQDSDQTDLLTSARLEVTKTNNQVSVTPGMPVTYELTVRNAGPGNVTGLDDPSLANVTDLFGCTPDGAGGHDCSASPFRIDTIEWTCDASGSGVLDFMAAYENGESDGQNLIEGLGGVSSLALIPAGAAGDSEAVRGNFLVAASVDDDALVFFRRDQGDGALSYYSTIQHDPAVTPLLGARSVTVSADGRLLFVVSRQSDSLLVFGLSGSDDDALIVEPIALAKNASIKGLDQALHVIAVSAGSNTDDIYVAGANDHAVAAFRFDRASEELIHLGSMVNGINDIQGLTDVEYLVASPDGEHVYALSGSSGSVVQFGRDSQSGMLHFIARFGSGALGTPLTGVSSASFDASGRYLYLTVSGVNRLVQLKRLDTPGAGNFGSLSLVTSLGQGEQGVQGLNNARRLVVSGDGQHLYVTSQAGSTLAWFSLHPESGVPTYQGIRANLSAGVEGLAGATGLVMDPQLNQIYVAGTLDSAITHFQRQSDSWCPPSGSGLIDKLAVNIAAGGQLLFHINVVVSSELEGELVNRADAEWESASCDGGSGTALQSCSDGDEDEDLPSRLADLSISKTDGLAEFDGLAGAVAIAADARNVYVAAPDDNAIGMFRRQPSAATGIGLSYLGVMRSGAAGISGVAGVRDLAVSADGEHVYAVSPVDNAIAGFERDSGSGRLQQISLDQNGLLGVTGLSGARALALSPDGEHVYVAGEYANAIAIFRRQTDVDAEDFGELSFVTAVQSGIEGVNGIEAPRALQMSADGKHLYVLGETLNSLVVFSRQTNSGSGNFGLLTQVARYQNGQGGVLGMDDVRSLALSADDEHLYVLGAAAGSLVHFERSPDDGLLTFVAHGDTEATLLLPDLVGATRLRMGGNGYLYVAATASNAIAVLELDADGKPALIDLLQNGDQPDDPSAGLVDGLDGIRDVAYVADGDDWLYAAAARDDALSEFAVENGLPGYLGTVFDGMGGVAPGDTVTYTIIVENHGPSDVQTARIIDDFPPEFEAVHWTCTGYAGSSCPGSGDGNVNIVATIPNGTHVQIEAQGVVRADAAGRPGLLATGGRLINTATVEAVGVLDPDMSNNSATDDDTVLAPRMDLSISIDNNGCDLADPGCVEVTEVTPGGSVNYLVAAANAGPTYAKSATVADSLPAALYDVSWTCAPIPEAGLLSQIGDDDEPSLDVSYRAVAVDTLGRHVYAVGQRVDGGITRDTLVVYRRDYLSGALTRVKAYSSGDVAELPDGSGDAPPVRGMDGAVDVAITADGRFVYVAGQDADAIAVFERDPQSGLLAWSSQVVDGEMGVQGIGDISVLALSPDGQHLYAGANSGRAVAGFAINPTSGKLTQVTVIRQSDAGVNGLNGVSDLAFNDSGELLFVTAVNNRSLTALRRAPATGALTYVTGIEDGEVGVEASLLHPSAVTVHGDRVFVADSQGDAVNLLRFVDGDTPAFEFDGLIELTDDMPGVQQPVSLVFVPDQQRLHVGAAASGQVHMYSLLDATPRLVESADQNTSPVLGHFAAMALGPDARDLYVVSSQSQPAGGGLIAALAREPGSRCPLSGDGAIGTQTVDIAPGGSVMFAVSGQVFANASGTLRYSASVDPRIAAFEINPIDNRTDDTDILVPAPDLETRKLRQTDADDVIAGLPIAYRLEVDNHGVSDALDALIHDDLPIFPQITAGLVEDSGNWTCAANEPLVSGASLSAGMEPRIADLSALVATADARRWFGVSRTRNALVELRLDASGDVVSVAEWTDGDDAGDAAISGLVAPAHVAISPDDGHLYVSANGSDSVLVFAVVDDGLVFVQQLVSGNDGIAGLRGAVHAVVSADGRHVYVAAVPADPSKSAIALFARDPDSGELSFRERIQDGIGTFNQDSNVIRGVKKLHLSADGAHLYAISEISQTLARFDVNPTSGSLRYQGSLRGAQGNGGTVLPELSGVRELIAAPGDVQLYVLADAGISLFDRALNGSLSLTQTWPVDSASQARALAIDSWGSRLYRADADGTVHLYAREWSNGHIEQRFSLASPLAGGSAAFLHLPVPGEVVQLQAGTDGGMSRFAEAPISRCLADAGDNSGLPTPIDLGVGGSSWLEYEAVVHPSARGVLYNAAWTEPGGIGIDPNPANDVGSDSVQIIVVSDLSIEKTGPETAVAGEYIDYEIIVRNAGPSDALGIRVRDELASAGFVDASWTCEASGGSHCLSASGSGNELDAEADLLVGDEITVHLTVKVHPAWIGALSNGAYVIPEVDSIDPTPDDQVAEPVITVVERHPDLQITKTNGVHEVVAGTEVVYTITVFNAGPSDAPDARVRDVLPPAYANGRWTCTAHSAPSGDIAVCGSPMGQGSILDEPSIPVGASVVYELRAMLRPSAIGQVTNTASVEVLGDAWDPDPDNNQATDTDVVMTLADLALSVDAPDAYDPDGPFAMPYRISVLNIGPSDAAESLLEIGFDHVVRIGNAACTPATGTDFTCVIDGIAAGRRHTLDLGVSDLPAPSAVLNGEVRVSSLTDDPDTVNNVANTVTQMRNGVDLEVTIDDGRTSIMPGDTTTYTITVRNAGSHDAVDARLLMPLGAGLTAPQWTCHAPADAHCAIGPGDDQDVLISLPSGKTLTYTLVAWLDMAVNTTSQEEVEQGAEAQTASGQADVGSGNHRDRDINRIIKMLFRDGFEAPPPLRDPLAAMPADRRQPAGSPPLPGTTATNVGLAEPQVHGFWGNVA